VRPYELLFILRPDLDEEAATALVERITGLITDKNGKLENVSRWGRRRLAYEVKDYKEGVYMLVHFQGDATLINEMDRVLKLADEILRFIIVRRGE